MPITNSKEWYDKSEIDYFSAFLKLWLSFNAFYKRLYQADRSLKLDRQFIEHLKGTDNIVKDRFREYYITLQSSEAVEFRFYFGEFVRAYSGPRLGNKSIVRDNFKGVKPQMNGSAVNEINFFQFIHPRNHTLRNNNINGYIKIENLYISNDINSLFPVFIEMLYMMRNLLVHGVMEPSEENHKSIKCCYILLRHLIKNEV
jgi:hypothetical protein